jgi:hypothetical protein
MMDVRADLGFSPPTAEKRQPSARAQQHRWTLTARTFGVSRFRCQRCGVVKTTNHAERVTKYVRGHAISGLAPPCEAQQ